MLFFSGLTSGVRKVIKVDAGSNPTGEILAEILLAAQKQGNYTSILAPATPNGKNVIPRVGAFLDVQPISG